MANNYAIMMYYSAHGARSISKCIGTISSREKADKYARLLRMTGKIEIEIKKQKNKVYQDHMLRYVMNPDNENKIRIEAISSI